MFTGLHVSWDISVSDFGLWVDYGTSFFWDQQAHWGHALLMAFTWNMPNNIPIAKASQMTKHITKGDGGYNLSK